MSAYDRGPQPWGDDPALVALLGAQGSTALRDLFDPFPDGVGLLWAIRGDEGRISDFSFGYGNPAILRLFRLPGSQHARYTLLEALPQMAQDGTFDRYTEVCDTGEPFVDEITFDTPFGDGYIRGTFMRRTAKLGDGLLVLVTDVTERRRMEDELRAFADIVAHDLREPITGIAHLVDAARAPRRRAARPGGAAPAAREHRARARAHRRRPGLRARGRAALGGGRARRPHGAGDAMTCARAWRRRARPRDRRAARDRGRRRQLRRLLQNLVTNAVKFRAQAPPQVAVSARAGNEGWVVTVRDNGRGVAPSATRRGSSGCSRARTTTWRARDRARGVPAHRRGARRAHLGRAGRGRRQRVPLHAAARLTARSATTEPARGSPGRPAGHPKRPAELARVRSPWRSAGPARRRPGPPACRARRPAGRSRPPSP